MQRVARTLTGLSILAALAGVCWWAVAASPTGSLPPANAVSGWAVVPDSTRAGAMGAKVSYDVYDGAVDAMKGQGIAYFAQRMYKHATTKKTLMLDVYQLTSEGKAKALFDEKRAGLKKANPLSALRDVKDRALVATLGGMSFGVCQRGKFLCEVSMNKATSAADRSTAKSFLVYVSKKLAG